MAQQRFEGSILLANLGFSAGEVGKAASAIVGLGGSGIKALTGKFPGLFVQVFNSSKGRDTKAQMSDCDTVYISGRSGADVQAAATAVAARARAVINGTSKAGPSLQVGCPTGAVGWVIGSGGRGLKQMGETAGDYCHIHFNRETGKFDITANTQAACDRAKVYIGQRIREFLKPKVENRPASRPRSNGFAGLVLESGDNGSGDELEDLVEASRPSVVSVALDVLSQGSQRSKGSIASLQASEVPQKIRWEIREELSKKVDPETGALWHQPFHRKDRETGADQFVKGVQAVPWSAVDDYIGERRADQKKRQVERMEQRSSAAATRRSMEERQSYLDTKDSESAFPTLGAATTKRTNGRGTKHHLSQSRCRYRPSRRHHNRSIVKG